MKISVVIVTWNSEAQIELCLSSIRDEVLSVGGEIIVVDNASQDGTRAVVGEKFPQVRMIKNSTNEGFSRGVNRGIFVSRGDNILLLNPDAVVSPGAILRCIRFLEEKPTVGVVGIRVLDESKEPLVGLGHPLPSIWGKMCEQLFVSKLFKRRPNWARYIYGYPECKAPAEVEFVAGCFLMVRRQVLAEVGPLDEQMFLFGEDVDFCWRVRNANWIIFLLGDVTAIHLGHASARQDVGGSLLEFYKAEEQVLVRYFSWGSRTIIRCLLVVGACLRWMITLCRRDNPGTKPVVVARRDIYRLVLGSYGRALASGDFFRASLCVKGPSSLSAKFLSETAELGN